ncbi:AMPN Aminopeptidase, partial [Acromyrmex charruanus]
MDFIKALCLVTLSIIIYDFKNEMYDLKNKKNEIRSAVEQIDRLPIYIVPTNYNIKLIPYFENYTLYTLEGETSIRIRIYQKTQYIYLHQYFLVIFDTPTLINEDNGNSYKLLWEQHIMYNSTTHILTFYLAEDLSPGFYILNMKFYGMPVHPKENILNSFINGTDVIWLNTGHFQPIRGRRLFPCWDEPAFKTTFKISILHHENYTALSNTPIQKLEFADNNMVWTHFRTTPLMSTYHVAVVLTNFLSDSINANAFEHQAIWCTTDSAQYTKFAENIFEIVTSHLGTRWNKKIAKLDHVVLPESENMWDWHFRDGMSLWGLIFYRERRIIYNEAIDPPSRKIEIMRLVTHEVVHHWLNNLIRLSWWSYLWITDGIAGLLAANTINENYYVQIFPDSRISDLFVVQMQHDSLNLDTHSLMKPLQQKINDIADIDLLFTSVSYIKAPVIFRMLQHVLTDVIFWEGINKYLNMDSKSSVSDLWTAMRIAYIELNSEYMFNLTKMMNKWITTNQYPVVNVIQDSRNGHVIISHKGNSWWIPITYTTQTDLHFNDTKPYYWLTPYTEKITIPNIKQFDWIILNLQQTGYYRVNYDLTMWQRIISYLNSDNYKNIHVLNRAQILDDAFYFAIEEKSLNLSTFWNLSHYLSRETDYVAWYPMIKAFEYLSIFIPFSEIGLEVYKMHRILPTIFKKIGYQEIPNENDLIKCLRQEIAKWACVLGDSDCRIIATSRLEWHFTNPEKHKILPWWKDWTFCKGLIKASDFIWMKMLDISKREHNKKILEYLTCSENLNIIRVYLNEMTDISLEINDRVNIFLRIIAKHAKNIKILEYILNNFEKIKPRIINRNNYFQMHNTSKKTMDRMEQQIEFMHETILKITKTLERTNNKVIIFRYIAYFKLWNLLYFMVKNLRRTSSYFSIFLFVTYYFLRDHYFAEIFKIKTVMGFIKASCLVIFVIIIYDFINKSYFMKNEKNEFHSAVEQIDRLPTYTVPTNYNVKLIPYFKKNSTAYTLRGETSTRIHIHKKTRNICFHQYFLFIFNISTLINEDNGIYLFLWPQYTHYNPVTHILTFYLTQDLLPGFYILNIKFYGMSILPKENDLKISYINRTPDVMWLNAVYFQPIRGRRLFPCWDEPAFKATFNISILHHENYTALSNTPIQKLEFADNNMVWTHFRTTPLMSTYHVAVVLTNFHSHRINANTSEHQAIWCRTYSAQYTKFAENIFEIVTSHLGIRWNKKIAKLDHVVLPESENMWNWYLRDGMSQWGLIFYRETRVLYNEAIDPPSRKIEIMRLVTHEVVHHWLNNLVRLSWWSYLWIIDGIAGLFAANAINEIFPDSRVSDLFVVQMQHDSLNLDTHSLMKPLQQEINDIADIDLLFTSVFYIKAPVIFRMLQHVLTDVIFWEGINKYLNMDQLNSANSDYDLWMTMQTAQIKSNSKYLPNLISIMSKWTATSQYPVVNVIRKSRSSNIIISQGKNTWWIPITYTTQTELNFNDTVPSHWLTPNVQQKIISNITRFDWIIFNLQQTGYYRVNYDLTMWRRIAYYLNSDNYKNIHVLNRAQILDDAFYFAIEEKSLNLFTFWNLSHYLSRETDYVAWYPMIKAFEYLSIFIPFSEIGLEEKMRRILPTLFKKIGYQEIPNEHDLTKCLRQEIAKWACVLGDSDCRNNAKFKLEWHFANPEKHKILPWWEDWTFCKGLIKANDSIWMKMLDISKKEHNKKILEYLTCSENSNIIQIYLNKITDNVTLEINDSVNIFLRIIAKHAKNIEILKYILENFEKIKPRFDIYLFSKLISYINLENMFIYI